MVPKTELIYSFPYNRLFNKSFNYNNLKELKNKYSKFEQLYSKYIKKILSLIEEYNEPWKKQFIAIYLTENTVPISEPLTLRYEPNEKYLLVVLIHELIHNNITKKFKDSKELHKFIDKIIIDICSQLDINLISEIEELKRRIT